MRNHLLTSAAIAMTIATLFHPGAMAAGPVKVPVTVDPLPDGWVAKPPVAKQAKLYATSDEKSAYFQLIEEPASDFSANIDLPGYAKLVKKVAAGKSKLTNRTETDLKTGKIAGRDTVEFEVTGETSGLKLHYRFIFVRIGDTFVEVSCWTTPSHWEDSQTDFEAVAAHLVETK